ncbi:MAG: hypothetical protein QG604_762 [Candidatus Dependentiae bacterium]|nr:hypothetical protein [Candidatus Dependentiae bacterium]
MNQNYTSLLQLVLVIAAVLAPSCMQGAEDAPHAEKMFHNAFVTQTTLEKRHIGSHPLFENRAAIIKAIETELKYQHRAPEDCTEGIVEAAIKSVMQRAIRVALEKSSNYLNIATFLYLKTKGIAFNLITTEALSNLYLPISCDQGELKIDLTRRFLIAETACHPIIQRPVKLTGVVGDEMQEMRNLIMYLDGAVQTLKKTALTPVESKEAITVATHYDNKIHNIETATYELLAFYNARLSLRHLIRVATILDESGVLHLYLLHETAD